MNKDHVGPGPSLGIRVRHIVGAGTRTPVMQPKQHARLQAPGRGAGGRVCTQVCGLGARPVTRD